MIVGLLWVVFIVTALLLCLIILIQEGKGGGLGEAFGGMGAETFGVKASGVNRVTAVLAGVWVVSAILINKCGQEGAGGEIFGEGPPANEAPAEPGGATDVPDAPEDGG